MPAPPGLKTQVEEASIWPKDGARLKWAGEIAGAYGGQGAGDGNRRNQQRSWPGV